MQTARKAFALKAFPPRDDEVVPVSKGIQKTSLDDFF